MHSILQWVHFQFFMPECSMFLKNKLLVTPYKYMWRICHPLINCVYISHSHHAKIYMVKYTRFIPQKKTIIKPSELNGTIVYNQESRLCQDILAVAAVWWGTCNYKCEKIMKCERRTDGHPDSRSDRHEGWNSGVH